MDPETAKTTPGSDPRGRIPCTNSTVRRSEGLIRRLGYYSKPVPEAVLAAGIALLQLQGAIMSDSHQPQPDHQDNVADTKEILDVPDIPLRTLLYRFMFFEWMFADLSAARNLFERHAFVQHNRRMCRYLPVYLRRWSVLTVCGFGLGLLAERAPQASLVSAWFFTWSCVSLTAMVIISVAWIWLSTSRMS